VVDDVDGDSMTYSNLDLPIMIYLFRWTSDHLRLYACASIACILRGEDNFSAVNIGTVPEEVLIT